MLASALQFAVCAGVIIVAGTLLTRYADAIAELTGLGRLVIGSVLLASATSLPELTVDISAVLIPNPDLAVGDLLGSSLMNLLILAVLDLTTHSRGRMLSKQAAAHALSGSQATALTAIVALGLLTGKQFTNFAVLGVSPAIWLVLGAYLLGVRLVYLDQRIALASAKEAGVETKTEPGMSFSSALLGFSICAGAILVAGPFLASAADRLAEQTGLGGTFVGTTLVAMATSLPELVSMLAALRLGAPDLAIGNVFGSNAFNMILLAPLDLAYPGPLLASVSPSHAVTAVAALLATQVAIMGQLYQAETRTRFIEPDAYLVIAIVLAALGLVYSLP